MTPKTAYRHHYPIGSIWMSNSLKRNRVEYYFIVGYGKEDDHILAKPMSKLDGPTINFFMQIDGHFWKRIA